jgi:hypothetical protein
VNTIKDKCPDQLKLPFALWTREAVRDLIHIKFGIRYGLGMVGRLLRRWGFTPQKPVTRAYERDDAKIRAWVKREYPVLHRRAQRENAEIYWEDETGLRSDHRVGRSYQSTQELRNAFDELGLFKYSRLRCLEFPNPRESRCDRNVQAKRSALVRFAFELNEPAGLLDRSIDGGKTQTMRSLISARF